MEAIRHIGVIEKIEDRHMVVRIVQYSACSECNAKAYCSSSDKKEKFLDVYYFKGNFRVGERVIISGKQSSGLKAVLIAYVVPLILMVCGMALGFYCLFPGNEGISALIALGLPLLYYLFLYPFRNFLQKRFVFLVNKMPDDGIKNIEDQACN